MLVAPKPHGRELNEGRMHISKDRKWFKKQVHSTIMFT